LPGPARFAATTEVPVAKTRVEIERLLIRHGATSTAFMNSSDRAMIMFEAHGRRIMIELPLPRRDQQQFTHSHGGRHRRAPEAALAAWEQACRQSWRALRLILLAKFEAIAGNVATFEDEFLPYTMLPDGRTVSDHVRPRVAAIYQDGKMQPLLPRPGSIS